jgi:hypothetical protein
MRLRLRACGIFFFLPIAAAAQDDAIKQTLEYIKEQLPNIGGNQQSDKCFAGLAFIAQGSTPGSGDYAAQLKECVDKVMSVEGTGFNQNWYNAIAGLFLAEVYKKEPNDAIKTKLEDIAKAMARSQEATGGWTHTKGHKYNLPLCKGPIPDICFLTSMTVAAIGNIKACGIKVPDGMLDKALANLASLEDGRGGIGYGTNNPLADKGGGRGGGVILGMHEMNNTGGAYGKYAQTLKERCGGLEHGHGCTTLHFLYGGIAMYLTGSWAQFKSTWIDKVLPGYKPGSFVWPSKDPVNMDKGGPLSSIVMAILRQMPKGNLFNGKGKAGGPGGGGPKNPFSNK